MIQRDVKNSHIQKCDECHQDFISVKRGTMYCLECAMKKIKYAKIRRPRYLTKTYADYL